MNIFKTSRTKIVIASLLASAVAMYLFQLPGSHPLVCFLLGGVAFSFSPLFIFRLLAFDGIKKRYSGYLSSFILLAITNSSLFGFMVLSTFDLEVSHFLVYLSISGVLIIFTERAKHQINSITTDSFILQRFNDFNFYKYIGILFAIILGGLALTR